MNANQIINMVIRTVMNRLIRTGVNAGINAAGKKMSKGAKPEESATRANAPESAETTKRMRQTMRVTRKIGRF